MRTPSDTGAVAPTDPWYAPYSEGPLECRLCFIGQAPGDDEEAAHRPFVGQAGERLNRLLESTGITRAHCRIENLYQFKLPRDKHGGYDVARYLRPRGKVGAGLPKMNVAPETIAAVSALHVRLSACTANVFVPLGNEALWALTSVWGITHWRGSILESALLPGRKVVPTLHPATRSWPRDNRLIQYDLLRARDQAAFPEMRRPRYQLLTSPTFGEAIAFIAHCHNVPYVATDIETLRDTISCISLAPSPDLSMCIPFVDHRGDVWTIDQEAELWRQLASLLHNPRVTKVLHNAAFDIERLSRDYGIRPWPIDDTMIAQAILAPDYPKSLAFVTSLHTELPYYKHMGESKMWDSLDVGDGTGEQRYWQYNALDSLAPRMAIEGMLRQLQLEGNLDSYRAQVRTVWPLVKLATTGIRLDVGGMRRAADAELMGAHRLVDEVRQLTGVAVMADRGISEPRVKKLLYDKPADGGFGAPVVKDHKTGRPTADADALRRIARNAKGPRADSIRAVARLLIDLRRTLKAAGTYYQMLIDPDGRLRCSWNPVGTPNARVSSSKTLRGTGMNQQNQPKGEADIRGMVIFMRADPGYLIVSVDYSMAELRTMAYIASEPTMIRALEAGDDLHKLTASYIYGVPIEAVEKWQRANGKSANFGLGYGQGPDGFSLSYDLSLAEARTIHSKWYQLYSGITRWHLEVDDQLRRTSTLTNIVGRSRKFLGVPGPDMFRDGYDFLCQSVVARRLNDLGLVWLSDRVDAGTPAVALNAVHDSIVFEWPLSAPCEQLVELLTGLKLSMEAPLVAHGRPFVLPIDVSVGYNLADVSDTNPQGQRELPREALTNPSRLVDLLKGAA